MRTFSKYFENAVLRTIKTVKWHASPTIRYYLKKMISFGNAASSHSGLIPLKTAYKKRSEGIALGDRE